VVMVDYLSIVETDKVIHTAKTDMVKHVVETKCFDMSVNEFDKKTGSSDRLKPKQADQSCVHALNEPHLQKVVMVDYLSIVETDKVIHTAKTDMVKHVVETKCFDMSVNEFDKKTGSSDRLKPKQADQSCVHALNEPHLQKVQFNDSLSQKSKH
nr:hypothetical protein [Tanacetum cinerariifolium]